MVVASSRSWLMCGFRVSPISLLEDPLWTVNAGAPEDPRLVRFFLTTSGFRRGDLWLPEAAPALGFVCGPFQDLLTF